MALKSLACSMTAKPVPQKYATKKNDVFENSCKYFLSFFETNVIKNNRIFF